MLQDFDKVAVQFNGAVILHFFEQSRDDHTTGMQICSNLAVRGMNVITVENLCFIL